MKIRDILLLLILGGIWGSSFIFLKIVTPVAGVNMTVSFRIILAAVAMLIVVLLMKKLPDYRKYWKEYLLLALLNLIIPFALLTYSVNHLPSSTVAILNATTPLFALAIGSGWLNEKFTLGKLFGVVIALSGLVILLGWMPLVITNEVLLSVAFSLLAALSYAIAGVFIKSKMNEPQPIKTATGQVTAGALVLLPVFFTQDVYNAGGEILGGLLALGLMCTALAYILFFQLIQRVSSTNASLVTVLVPVFSTLWGVIFLNEPVTSPFLIGLALIVVSLVMILSSGSKSKVALTTKRDEKLDCYYCLN